MERGDGAAAVVDAVAAVIVVAILREQHSRTTGPQSRNYGLRFGGMRGIYPCVTRSDLSAERI